jgi:DNA-binding MarR family transcriptional regulator
LDRHSWLTSYTEKFIIHRRMWEAEWVRLNKSGLSSSQALMLIILNKNGPQQAKDLIGLLAFSSGGITVISEKLIKMGFIRKVKIMQDRRAHFLEITAEGLEIYPVVMEEWNNVMDQVFSVLSDVEVAILAQLFAKLVYRK